MGKVLTLPRTEEEMARLAYYGDRVPDFAARLRWWHRQDMERRERFRRDMAIIVFDGGLNLAHPRTPDGVYVWHAEPPAEGA
jgi:hypothetical protein